MTNVQGAQSRETAGTWFRIGIALLALAWLMPAACGDDGASPSDDGGDTEATDAPDGDGSEGETTSCVDTDRDGYGRGCALGPDCDDTDPTVYNMCSTCGGDYPPAGCVCFPTTPYPCYDGPAGTENVGQCTAGERPCVANQLQYECSGQILPDAVETCGDGVDNNCNGLGDEEAASPCGDCVPTCNTSGTVIPDPEDPGAANLGLNPGGTGVVLGVDDIRASYVWTANTDEGSVSRIDIATGAETGRYRVGQTGMPSDAPSRTAVDGIGDLYVANQANVSTAMAQGSVTKIAGSPSHCVDRDRDGAIETSSGATRLPLGADECWLWTVPVGAAEATPRAMAVHVATDGTAGTPWVGTVSERRFYRLDPGNGSEVSTVDVEVDPFGAVATRSGWIWISGRSPAPAGVQRFNATSGGLDPVVPAPTQCDPYGIAADSAGRVWIGGTGGNVCRYSPPPDDSWLVVAVPRANAPGIAVSDTDQVWVASYDGLGVTLSQFPSTDPTLIVNTDVPGNTPYGVDADRVGTIWTVNYGSSTVTRFNPTTLETAEFATGRGPVAYSDFTGFDRTIVATSGTWSEDFERCDAADADRWGEVLWTATTPGDSSVTISAASAAIPDDLGTAFPVTLVRIPPGSTTPVDIETAFAAAAVTAYPHLRLIVSLVAGTGGESPVLESVEVRWHCAGG
jgi:streptogramin lyase